MYMIKTSRIAATTAAGMFLSHPGRERAFLIAPLKTRVGSGRISSGGRMFVVFSGEETIWSSPCEPACVLAVAGVLPERETLGADRRVSAAPTIFSVGRRPAIRFSLSTFRTRTQGF